MEKNKSKNLKLKILLVVFLAVLFAAKINKAEAATVYVDNAATNCSAPSDSDYAPATRTCGSGGLSIVFSTISGAINAYTDGGHTINIRGGAYNISSPVYLKNTGTAVTTIQNYNNETVLINGQGISTHILLFSNSDTANYITIKGLKITGATSQTYSGGITIGAGKHDIIIDGVESYGNTIGITAVSTDNVIIQNSVIHNTNAGGIVITGGATDTLIQNNEVYNAGGTGGIELFNNSNATAGTYTQRTKILNNKAHNNRSQGIWVFKAKYILVKGNECYLNGATGIQVEDDVWYDILDGNILHDNADTNNYEGGWWIDEARYSFVKNNISYNNFQGGAVSQSWYTSAHHNAFYNNKGQQSSSTIHTRSFYLSDGIHSGHALFDYPSPAGSQYNYFANNTSHNDGSADTSLGGFILIDNGLNTNNNQNYPNTDPILNNKFINNIISNRGGTAGYEIDGGGLTAAMVFNNNLYYNSANTNRWKWNNNAYTTFTGWKTASSQDANSKNSDPLFVNAGALNLNLQNNSPAINAGGFLTTTTGSGTNSTIMIVADPYWFTDGLGLDTGDMIQLAGQTKAAVITSINYDTKTLTLNIPLTWTNGQGIAFAYSGSTPDIGAYEYAGTTFNPADVNQDGNINIQDIQICVKVITGTLTNPRADVNGDGVKNIKDIQAIVRAITG